MARKKKHEEHVNLERYLVSYADFITLLFATFVVLYALSQVDISQYTKLEDSMKKAFAAPSILSGSQGVLNDGSSIFEGGSTDSVVPPMLEYVSAKYEQDSFDEIQQDVSNMHKNGELGDVNVSVDERGLVIKFSDINVFFNPGSADLTGNASSKLSEIGKILSKKFVTHMIRVEGHTDNQPVNSKIFPSNWELSSARASTIVKFLIKTYKFKPDRFSAIGYADTRPIASNNTAQGRRKNRRVEIVVLRNKFMSTEAGAQGIMSFKSNTPGAPATSASSPTAQNSASAVKKIEQMHKDMNISSAAQDLMKQQHMNSKNVVILNDTYDQESKRIEGELSRMEQQNNQKIYGPNGGSAPVENVTPVHMNVPSTGQAKPSIKPAINAEQPKTQESKATPDDGDVIKKLLNFSLEDKLKKKK